ncbi:MAG: acetyl-CoA carboxylase biotin carboxyl carrier protein subunit [Bacteriovoracaceae bacterium]
MEKKFNINGREVSVQNFKADQNNVSFTLNGKNYSYSLVSKNGTDLILDNGSRFHATVGSLNKDGEAIVMALGREAIISAAGKKSKKAKEHAGGLTSPMPGKIFKILKEVGAEVKKGEAILILEAMKMEHSIRSDKDGKVKSIPYKVGELVQGGVVLAEVE